MRIQNNKLMGSVLMLIIISIVACGCGKEPPHEVKIIGSIAKDEYRITDEEFNEKLHHEYGLENLEKHEMYFKEGLIQAEFYFNNNLEQWQEDSVYLLVSNAFIYRKYDPISGGHVYDGFVRNQLEDRVDISGLSLLIYLDDKLVTYQMYLPDGQQVIHLISE